MLSEFLNYKKDINKKVDNQGRLIINQSFIKELVFAIKEGKIPLIMNEEDKKISIGEDLPNSNNYTEKAFTKLSEIVAVHVTSIPPMNDTIITHESSGLMNEMKFIDPSTGIEHIVPYLVRNDTIHFTLNCVVHNHESGNDWNSYKYGVLINFNKLNKNKILDVKSEDTFIDGDARLESDYFLFCPLGEREQIAKDNPKATIIEYSGITLYEAISYMIIFSGQKLKLYGTYGWGKNFEYGLEDDDITELEKLVLSEGYPVLKGQFGNALHSETKYMARRMWKREYEALINLIKYNQENNIDMPDDVLFLIMVYGGAYNLPGTVPVSIKDYKEVVFPILEKYGYYIDDSIFEGIEEDSNMKIIYSKDGTPIINCPDWEIALRNKIIKILKNSFKNNLALENNRSKSKI